MIYRWMSAAVACLIAGAALADELKTGATAAVGGAAGAVIGQAVGGRNGAVLGGAVGGATGAAVGSDGAGRTGAIVGGAVGGASGAAVGQRTGGSTGAVVGAGIGAGAGAAVGEAVSKPARGGAKTVARYPGAPAQYGAHPSCNGKKNGHHKHGKYNKHGC